MVRKYLVGGACRDMIMGIAPKDMDYSVEAGSFEEMREYIKSLGGQIFLEKEEFVTIRARIGKETADYVLCRKDGEYTDGRRPDKVEPGTLYDDLSRRDFTMNAIAIADDGEVIDPFYGRRAIQAGLIVCVGNTEKRMSEDYLRLLRAARFSITKKFKIDPGITAMYDMPGHMMALRDKISEDRKRDEVFKMFKFDTERSIEFFGKYPMLSEAVFSGKMWLKATSEE